MANDNFSRGLAIHKKSLRVNAYRANTAADLYLGMPVALGADGFVAAIVPSTAGWQRILGSVVGFLIDNATPHELDPFLDVSDLGNVTAYALVADHPEQEFIMQEDTGGTALTVADAGLVAEVLYMTGSGNANSGWANLEIDRSTVGADTAGQVKLLRLVDSVNSDGTTNTVGNYGKWVVRIQGHEFGYDRPGV